MKIHEVRVKIYPSNFTAIRQFYEDVLKFTVSKEWDRGEKDRGAMFDLGNATFELLVPENGHKPVQGCGLSLEIEDVDALWLELKSKTEIIFEPRNNSWGDRSFRIADPEGFEITFFTKLREK